MNRGDAPRVVTLGCRLNACESEAMAAMLERAGLADTLVVNSCAVTTEAVRKTRREIRRLRRENPTAHIVVTGCAAQTGPEGFAAMAEVDTVLGNHAKMQLETWQSLAGRRGGVSARVQVEDIMSVTEAAAPRIDGLRERARAHVQIQNGCDHRCTFCIIPYGRGNSRSVPAGDVVDQVRRLADRGYSEVVLTGVDLTSWGGDLPAAPRLGDLVMRILRSVPGLPRLRLSSIDSIEVDDMLMQAIATEPRLMPHLHLSLQSGDDMILKRMKRRHRREDALRFCEEVRRLRPDIVFGADIIAGFPTETEAMFENSLRLIDECGLTWLHVFPYSPRPGTPAARMPQLPTATIRARAARLRERGAARADSFLQAQVGRRLTVLAEGSSRGRTAQFAEVVLETPQPAGRLVEADVVGVEGRALRAVPAAGC